MRILVRKYSGFYCPFLFLNTILYFIITFVWCKNSLVCNWIMLARRKLTLLEWMALYVSREVLEEFLRDVVTWDECFEEKSKELFILILTMLFLIDLNIKFSVDVSGFGWRDTCSILTFLTFIWWWNFVANLTFSWFQLHKCTFF